MALFSGLNPVWCLWTSLFSGRSVDVHCYLDCQRHQENVRSWWHRKNVWGTTCGFSQLCFPQNPNSSPQPCVPLPWLAQSWVCVGHSLSILCLWVLEGPSSCRHRYQDWSGRLAGWLQLLRKALGDGHSFGNLASSTAWRLKSGLEMVWHLGLWHLLCCCFP